MNQCVSDSPPNWPRCGARLIVTSHTDRRTSTRVESGSELTPRHYIHYSRSPPQPRQTTLQQSELHDAPNTRTVPPEKGSRPHPESTATSQRAAIPPNDHWHLWNQKLPLIRSARRSHPPTTPPGVEQHHLDQRTRLSQMFVKVHTVKQVGKNDRAQPSEPFGR
jgi:hypothetical protein